MQMRNVTIPVPDSAAEVLYRAAREQNISASAMLRPVLMRAAEKLAQHYGVTLDAPNEDKRHQYRMPAECGHPVGVSTTVPGPVYSALRALAITRNESLMRVVRHAVTAYVGFDPVTFEDKRTPAQKRMETIAQRQSPESFAIVAKPAFNPEQVD